MAADPELLVDGLLERLVVGVAGRQRGAGAGDDLVEQLLEPVGEDDDLLLLQRHGHDARAVDGLQVEGAFAGRADGAGDESAGAVEEEELPHDASSLVVPVAQTVPPPAPPPTVASSAPEARGAGASAARTRPGRRRCR